jgi:hypothetical protein
MFFSANPISPPSKNKIKIMKNPTEQSKNSLMNVLIDLRPLLYPVPVQALTQRTERINMTLHFIVLLPPKIFNVFF